MTVDITKLPAMTSPVTSGRQLSKIEKTAKNAASNVVVSNFSGVVFCLAQPFGGLLVRQNGRMAFWPCVMICVRRRRSFGVRRQSQSEQLEGLENGLTKVWKGLLLYVTPAG